jgi:hypothetical protein
LDVLPQLLAPCFEADVATLDASAMEGENLACSLLGSYLSPLLPLHDGTLSR